MFAAVQADSMAEWAKAQAIINYRYRDIWSSTPPAAIIILKIQKSTNRLCLCVALPFELEMG